MEGFEGLFVEAVRVARKIGVGEFREAVDRMGTSGVVEGAHR